MTSTILIMTSFSTSGSHRRELVSIYLRWHRCHVFNKDIAFAQIKIERYKHQLLFVYSDKPWHIILFFGIINMTTPTPLLVYDLSNKMHYHHYHYQNPLPPVLTSIDIVTTITSVKVVNASLSLTFIIIFL